MGLELSGPGMAGSSAKFAIRGALPGGPLLYHGSEPKRPSSAAKTTPEPKGVTLLMLDEFGPAKISAMRVAARRQRGSSTSIIEQRCEVRHSFVIISLPIRNVDVILYGRDGQVKRPQGCRLAERSLSEMAYTGRNMNPLANLFSNVPEPLAEELVQTLFSAEGVRIERIVSLGQTSKEGFWYDQSVGEWVVVLRGAARLLFEDGELMELVAGSYVNIEAHRR